VLFSLLLANITVSSECSDKLILAHGLAEESISATCGCLLPLQTSGCCAVSERDNIESLFTGGAQLGPAHNHDHWAASGFHEYAEVFGTVPEVSITPL